MKLLQTIFYINVEDVPPKNVKEYMDKIKAELMSYEAMKEEELAKVPNLIRRTYMIPVKSRATQVTTEICDLG